jgi:hypothetical protein
LILLIREMVVIMPSVGHLCTNSAERIAALRPVERVGQQTLAAFLASLPIAWSLGILRDRSGRDALTIALANLAGLLAILATAHITGWVKRQP